jgi:hypothetical protein
MDLVVPIYGADRSVSFKLLQDPQVWLFQFFRGFAIVWKNLLCGSANVFSF